MNQESAIAHVASAGIPLIIDVAQLKSHRKQHRHLVQQDSIGMAGAASAKKACIGSAAVAAVCCIRPSPAFIPVRRECTVHAVSETASVCPVTTGLETSASSAREVTNGKMVVASHLKPGNQSCNAARLACTAGGSVMLASACPVITGLEISASSVRAVTNGKMAVAFRQKPGSQSCSVARLECTAGGRVVVASACPVTTDLEISASSVRVVTNGKMAVAFHLNQKPCNQSGNTARLVCIARGGVALASACLVTTELEISASSVHPNISGLPSAKGANGS